MQQHFDVKLKGRVGTEDKDEKHMRVLNRIITVTSDGLTYEPDPRHAELLARDLGLENGSKILMVPGQKPTYDPDKHKDMPKDEDTDSLEDIIASITSAKKKCLRVRFAEQIEQHEYPASTLPAHHLLHGPIGSIDCRHVPMGCCPSQGYL